MAINKVVIGENTVMDISTDTLEEASSLPQNVTAHNKNGELITGTAIKQSTETVYISDIEQVPPSLSGPLYVLPECEYTVDLDPLERDKLVSGNIKKDVTILGVSGSSTVVDVSDASADLSSSDIINEKSAYDGNGNKISGTATIPDEYPIGGSLAAGTATKYYVERGLTSIKAYSFYCHASSLSSFSQIQEYDIPSTVTSIETYAFSNNKALTLISDVSNVSRIGTNSFYGCISLGSINFPSITTVPENAFYGCTSLSSFVAPNLTTISTKAFYSCTSLKNITTTNVTSLSTYAFSFCSSLENIDIPNVASIGGYAFQNCTSLSTANISGATLIQTYAFSGCTSLKSIGQLSATTISTYAFMNCGSLLSLDAPSVEEVNQGAFQNCTSLNSVSLPSATTIGSSSFSGCTALTTVDISNASTIGGAAFYQCTNLTTLSVKNGVKVSANGYFCPIGTIQGPSATEPHMYYQQGTSSNAIYRDNSTTKIGTLTSKGGVVTDYGITFTRVVLENDEDDENEENVYDFTITW